MHFSRQESPQNEKVQSALKEVGPLFHVDVLYDCTARNGVSKRPADARSPRAPTLVRIAACIVRPSTRSSAGFRAHRKLGVVSSQRKVCVGARLPGMPKWGRGDDGKWNAHYAAFIRSAAYG